MDFECHISVSRGPLPRWKDGRQVEEAAGVRVAARKSRTVAVIQADQNANLQHMEMLAGLVESQ